MCSSDLGAPAATDQQRIAGEGSALIVEHIGQTAGRMTRCCANIEVTIAEFHAAQQPGGAIFQFVRRCSHTGNYLQAPHIMHLAIVEQLTPGKVVGQVGAHAKHFSDAHIVQTSRGMFTALHTKFTDNHGRGKIFA